MRKIVNCLALVLSIVAISSPVQASDKQFRDTEVLIKQGMYGEAEELVQEMLLVNPENSQAYFLRAQIQAAKKRYKNALRDYTLALRYQPYDARILLKRSQLESQLGLHEQAEMGLKNALELGKPFLSNLGGVAPLTAEEIDYWKKEGQRFDYESRLEQVKHWESEFQFSRAVQVMQELPKQSPFQKQVVAEIQRLKNRARSLDLQVKHLQNMTYKGMAESQLRFSNGKFVKFDAYTTASLVQLTLKDLNGDGVRDGVAIYAVNGGGSGTFIYMAEVLATAKGPQLENTTFLGDRIVVKEVFAKPGKIAVNMLAHRQDDASCCPSLKVLRNFYPEYSTPKAWKNDSSRHPELYAGLTDGNTQYVKWLMLKANQTSTREAVLLLPSQKAGKTDQIAVLAQVDSEFNLNYSNKFHIVYPEDHARINAFLKEKDILKHTDAFNTLLQEYGIQHALGYVWNESAQRLEVQYFKPGMKFAKHWNSELISSLSIPNLVSAVRKSHQELFNEDLTPKAKTVSDWYWKQQTLEAFVQTNEIYGDTSPDKRLKYEVLVKKYPKNPRLIRFYADTVFEDSPEEYESLINLALKYDPQYATAWNQKGLFLRNHGKTQEAIESFHTAIQIDPQSIGSRTNLYWELAKLPLSGHESWLQLHEAQQVAAWRPRSAATKELLGNALYFLSFDSESLAQYEAGLKIEPQYAPLSFSLGRYHSYYKNYAKALQYLNQAVSLQPENDYYLNWRGDTHYNLGNYTAAIVDYKNCTQLAPQNHEYWSDLGHAYSQIEKYPDAVRSFEKARSIHPLKIEYLVNEAQNQMRSGDYAAANRSAQIALQADPQNILARFTSAYSLSEMNQTNDALKAYNELLKYDPQNASAFNNRGTIHMSKKMYQNAVTDFSQAIRFAPREGMYFNNRGIAYHNLEYCEAANQDYKKACELGYSSSCEESCQSSY